MKARICTLAVAAALFAVAAAPSPALGSGFTLRLSAPSTPVVGQPMVLQATGTIPPEYLQFLYWFSLEAIPTAVTSTCPADSFEAMQFAAFNGGTHVVVTQREQPDVAGNFSIPVAITPSAPGSVLLCAYTDDGATNTLARASLTLNIRAAGSSRARSGAAAIRFDTVVAIRGCRAVLSPSQSRVCIRRAVARASSRCRRLSARRSRAACLRGVRRLGARR